MGVDERFLRDKHGPCPFCGGTDRFRYDDLNGEGRFFCNGCGPGDGMDFAMRWLQSSFKEAAALVRQLLATAAPAASMPAPKPVTDPSSLQRVWREASPVQQNDAVARYLTNRGLSMPAYPAALRFHPRLAYYDAGAVTGVFPAMLAQLVNARGNICGLHRTYLLDGAKAPVDHPRKVLGVSGVVRLFEPVGGVLGVAEGIETALAVHLMDGGTRALWACGSAAGMEAFDCPPSAQIARRSHARMPPKSHSSKAVFGTWAAPGCNR